MVRMWSIPAVGINTPPRGKALAQRIFRRERRHRAERRFDLALHHQPRLRERSGIGRASPIDLHRSVTPRRRDRNALRGHGLFQRCEPRRIGRPFAQ